jgi:xanthine/CO dehydrogenase XdhC/CoxF family maturation factor
MALATVYDTLGSTYTKAGHRIIIADYGAYTGLVSGGCLEGDLAEHAARVLSRRSAQPVTYDLRDEVDDVFGLGVGCNGLIRIFIQPLLPEENYQPFAALRDLYETPEPRMCATVIETADRGPPSAGATFLLSQEGAWEALNRSAGATEFAELLNARLHGHGEPRLAARFINIENAAVLIAPIVPIPRLLILGAGLDSVPLVRMAAELGWYVEIVDHRPAYLERDDLSAADSARLVDPRDSRNVIGENARFDVAVVMSHHLETDCAYLRTLAPIDLQYLGVLGPPARREKLLGKLEPDFPDLRRRLHGPIGLDIGGSGAEVIALSILAELQSVLSEMR